MKSFLPLIILCLTAVTGNAQERAATGTTETQMTWSALSSKVNSTQSYAEGVNSRVDQIAACGKKGLVYAPGHAGADTGGCLSAKYLADVVACGRENKVYSATTKSCVLPTELTSILTCSNLGKLYNPTAKDADKKGCVPTSSKLKFTNCHDRAGTYGVHVYCGEGQVVTKVCGAGRDPDCIAPKGTLLTVGSNTRDGYRGPKQETILTSSAQVFTVITCCSLE